MKPNDSIPPHLELTDSAQSREIDRKTIEDFGIDSFTLMEIAASKAASFIRKHEKGHRGFFYCGKGNNAGDALAAARYLSDQANHHITVFLNFGEEDLSRDARTNLTLLKKLENQGLKISFTSSFPHSFDSFDYIVDGLFGTGLNSELVGDLPEKIQTINQSKCRIYALDVPSGLNADNGNILGICIKADYTLTFGTNKVGFYLSQRKEQTGEVVFLSLPFPRFLREKTAVLINPELQQSFPPIKRQAKHKYENGVVHLLAGSGGLTGAAVMAARSAWKQGAGAVLLYAPEKLLPIYETLLPQVIKISVGEAKDTFYRPHHADQILQKLKEKPGVLLAGPGIGTNSETGIFLKSILTEFQGNVLLDADGLAFYNELKPISVKQKSNWILTPHPGEAKKYLGGNFENDFERMIWASDFSKEHGCTILLKGNPVILASSERGLYITEYDTSVFTRAGFGDVLAGTIACNIGISKETVHSAIIALNKGYTLYKQSNSAEVFGPEHLL